MERAFRAYWPRAVLVLFFTLAAAFSALLNGRAWPVFSGVSLAAAALLVIPWSYRLCGRFTSALVLVPMGWLACVIAVEGIILPRRCTPSSLGADAAPVILKLEEYRKAHGRYPVTLAAAGIDSPRFRCGSFDYGLDRDGHCWLSIGEYSRDDFTASWDSKTKEWSVDS